MCFVFKRGRLGVAWGVMTSFKQVALNDLTLKDKDCGFQETGCHVFPIWL